MDTHLCRILVFAVCRAYLDQERQVHIIALGRCARRLLVAASRNEINALQNKHV